MLSLGDCIAMSGLTAEEIEAIAEHEHLPEVIATALGSYLLRRPDGPRAIEAIIRDDIDAARDRGAFRHAAELKLVLRQFIEHCSVKPGLRHGQIGPSAYQP